MFSCVLLIVWTDGLIGDSQPFSWFGQLLLTLATWNEIEFKDEVPEEKLDDVAEKKR